MRSLRQSHAGEKKHNINPLVRPTCCICCSGGRDNLSDVIARAIKSGQEVYARELPAPLGGALTEKAILKGHNFQWNDRLNGGRFNGSLDAFDIDTLAM